MHLWLPAPKQWGKILRDNKIIFRDTYIVSIYYNLVMSNRIHGSVENLEDISINLIDYNNLCNLLLWIFNINT